MVTLLSSSMERLQIGELQRGNGRGPVAVVRNNQHRFWSHDGSELRLTGTARRKLYGLAALAGTTAVEMRGEVNNGSRGCHALVEQGEQDGMRSAA